MKYKYYLLLLFFSQLFFSQNAIITFKIKTAFIDCEKDTITKKIQIIADSLRDSAILYSKSSNTCKNSIEINLKPGKYNLSISSYGYTPISYNLKLDYVGQKLMLNDFLLKKETIKEIKEVTILGERREFVKVEADKTIYTVKNNPILSTGMVSDVVKKLPGVLISTSGSLALNGKDMSIYIDGIPSNLSGQDLISYIQSLPANTVEKIELMSNPGASFEANTNGGIINIITFNKSRKGINGTLNLHYGVNKNNKPAPSLILNGRGKKNSWQLQTGYNYLESNNYTNTYRNYYTFSPSVNFAQSINTFDINRNFYLRPMINFKVTEDSNIIFNYNLNVANNSNNSASNSFTENYNPNFTYTNNSNNSNNNNNNEFILKYKTKLDSLGKALQITSYYSIYNKINYTNSIQENEMPLYSIVKNSLTLNNFYIKYDFEIPLNRPKLIINIMFPSIQTMG